MDAVAQFKQSQKSTWAGFAPLETFTCMPAARLAVYAQVQSGQRVLDVGCGTGVVSVAAARTGARVTGLDLTPQLLVRARENAALAGQEIEWHEGDAEAMPFADGSFDVVVSQFGHMFAPRPAVVVEQMLRVLKPGGTIAFATWPPELYIGSVFGVVGRYLPPPPPGVSPPAEWGSTEVVRERLGAKVTGLQFDRGTLRAPYVSAGHVRASMELSSGPVIRVLGLLKDEPVRLAAFRQELDALSLQFFEPTENVLRQDYLLTRAKKV